jgi:hypothetical protein
MRVEFHGFQQIAFREQKACPGLDQGLSGLAPSSRHQLALPK